MKQKFTILAIATLALAGVILLAQVELLFDPRPSFFNTYLEIFFYSGPICWLTFLFMYGCMARAAFSNVVYQKARPIFFCILPALLACCVYLAGGFSNLPIHFHYNYSHSFHIELVAWQNKLTLLFGATASALCFLIIGWRRKCLRKIEDL